MGGLLSLCANELREVWVVVRMSTRMAKMTTAITTMTMRIADPKTPLASYLLLLNEIQTREAAYGVRLEHGMLEGE